MLNAFLRCLNALSQSSSHKVLGRTVPCMSMVMGNVRSGETSMRRSWRRGAEITAKFSMNRRLNEASPRKDFNAVLVRGVGKSCTALTCLGAGRKPSSAIS